MMRRKTLLYTTLLLVLLPMATMGRRYAVIVNRSNSMRSIRKALLKRIFLGKIKQLNGTKAVPIYLRNTSRTARDFLRQIVRMSPSEYKDYWVVMQITGKGITPLTKRSVAGVKAMVREIPGAIGYIPVADVDGTVKKIDIR